MRTALLATALALAGCSAPAGDEERAPLVDPEAFGRVDAPWVLQVAGGCGFCYGREGFDPSADHEALFVFRDGRVLAADFNGGPGGEADATRLHPNVTFDAAQLDALLDDSPRGGTGERWVVRVATGRLADEDALAAMEALWTRGAPDGHCTDTGIAYLLRRADGTVEQETFTCGPTEGPMLALASRLGTVREDALAHGVLQGAAPAPGAK